MGVDTMAQAPVTDAAMAHAPVITAGPAIQPPGVTRAPAILRVFTAGDRTLGEEALAASSTGIENRDFKIEKYKCLLVGIWK